MKVGPSTLQEVSVAVIAVFVVLGYFFGWG
jgi:hypothetical protein